MVYHGSTDHGAVQLSVPFDRRWASETHSVTRWVGTYVIVVVVIVTKIIITHVSITATTMLSPLYFL